MSDFTAKNQRGLMEAYASMYQQPIQEDKVEDVEYQEYEIDSDALYESIVDYLVSEGYVETEKQAVAMIPHLSEGWFNSIVGNIVISEALAMGVSSLLEEGCDLSSYTWDELYAEYTSHLSNVISEEYGYSSDQVDLHEFLPALAAPVLANPATWAAGAALTGGAVLAGKKALDALGQRRRGWDQSAMDNIQWRDTKPKPQTVLKSTTPDPWAGSSTVPPKTPQATTQRVPIKGPSGPTGPSGPKGPNFFQRALTKLSSGMKKAGAPAGQNPLISAGGRALETTGKGIWNAPGAAVKTAKALGKPGFWTGALKTLVATELGALAGRRGKSPTGETLKAAGGVLQGLGGAASNAPREAGAVQQGVQAWQKAREERRAPAPASQPGSTSAIDKLKKLQ